MPILAAKESEGEEGGWAEPERDGQECNPGPIVVEYYHRRGDRLAPSPNPGLQLKAKETKEGYSKLMETCKFFDRSWEHNCTWNTPVDTGKCQMSAKKNDCGALGGFLPGLRTARLLLVPKSQILLLCDYIFTLFHSINMRGRVFRTEALATGHSLNI
ncbi:uncharacterized protein [Drosophila pseudoobscura]|uniref:Uncharacterized protein isoform X4 n=1 Tax=Drosophila pseudoobscura pseudoobscura TaxID=46245 RepID=A0A6I8VQ79_DROPS|nr:uncharacterized protein LOC26533523 isoform X4 [Drosophila pseudoobscura]